jgi:hypothetical protein
MRMRMGLVTILLIGAGIPACRDRDPLVPVTDPAAPVGLEARYYDRAVYLTWELGPGWVDEPFRIYGKRTTDANFFMIAEVTNCRGGLCSYTDVNIAPNVTYDYYVSAVDPVTGVETTSPFTVQVFVPHPVPPPVPGGLEVVALDGAVYLRWNTAALQADDFSHYRVYLSGTSSDFLLGETDSEGFLDLLVENGSTYTYFVTSVDDQGHESSGSTAASGTPRPDYHGEYIYAHEDQPSLSGFRFRSDETLDPIVSGTSPLRHFRLEVDGTGWYLVPGPTAEVHRNGFETTALRCGPAADAGCTEVDFAPATNYSGAEIALQPQTTYVLRYEGGDQQLRYGAIRVTLLGFDQNDNALMIFDWAHQLQPGNRNLSPVME